MTIVIIIAISFFVVVGIVLGVYLLIMKKKEHHLEGDTKMDALTQNPVQDQNMFSQPLPQDNNPLMGSTTQDTSSMPTGNQVMNDIVSPEVSAPSAQVNDFSPTEPEVAASQMSVEAPVEETVVPTTTEQEVSVQESPTEEPSVDTVPVSTSATPDFPSFNAEPASQGGVQGPALESSVATQPEPALEENIKPTLDDVPLPPVENINPQPEEPSATEMGTVQSGETVQGIPQEQSPAEGVQIPVNQVTEPQLTESPVKPEPQVSSSPTAEDVSTSTSTEGAGGNTTMADLSRGLNISQPTTDQTGEGTPEPPVKDI